MSPTIVNERGYRVMIYTDDHTPAHVHVTKAGHSARIQLDPVELMDHTGFKSTEVSLALDIVKEHQAELLEAWDKIHPKR